MRSTRILPALAVVAALSSIASTARAEDFTFTLPIDLRSLPARTMGFGVTCFAIRDSDGRGGMNWGTAVGRGDVFTTISGGAFRGDVTVRFNSFIGQNPNDARYWECFISHVSVTTDRGVLQIGMIDLVPGTRTETQLPLLAGAPNRVRSWGAIVR